MLKRGASDSVQLRAVNICRPRYVLYFHSFVRNTQSNAYYTQTNSKYENESIYLAEVVFIIECLVKEKKREALIDYYVVGHTSINMDRYRKQESEFILFLFFVSFRTGQIDVNIQFAMFKSI